MNSKFPFKWRHFLPEVILLNVPRTAAMISRYRDLEEIMLERGVDVDHTTIHRWVQAYAPERRHSGSERSETDNRLVASR